MLQRDECETLLVQHLEWARRVMQALCRRHRMATADTDDFVSWATLRIVENDYHILRQFRADSSLRTYLTVVFAMLHREFRAKHWGRWRPCAVARRGGPDAIELDRLISRDRLPVRQAVLVLSSRSQAAMSERELMRLASSLPSRVTAAEADGTSLVDIAASQGADERVAIAESAQARSAVTNALESALEGLSADDQALLRMRFWQGLTIADIARRLGVQQKPLYRRVKRLLVVLRDRLEGQGVSMIDARALLSDVAA